MDRTSTNQLPSIDTQRSGLVIDQLRSDDDGVMLQALEDWEGFASAIAERAGILWDSIWSGSPETISRSVTETGELLQIGCSAIDALRAISPETISVLRMRTSNLCYSHHSLESLLDGLLVALGKGDKDTDNQSSLLIKKFPGYYSQVTNELIEAAGCASDNLVRAMAIWTLAAGAGFDEVFECLRERMTSDEDVHLRFLAAFSLGNHLFQNDQNELKIPDQVWKELIDGFAEVLWENDEDVRHAALFGIAQCEERATAYFPAIHALWRREEPPQSLFTTYALGSIDPQRAGPAVTEEIVQQLGDMARFTLLEVLSQRFEPLLGGGSLGENCGALAFLSCSSFSGGDLNVVQKALNSSEPMLIASAIKFMLRHGEEENGRIEIMAPHLNDDHMLVRSIAQGAVKKIDVEGEPWQQELRQSFVSAACSPFTTPRDVAAVLSGNDGLRDELRRVALGFFRTCGNLFSEPVEEVINDFFGWFYTERLVKDKTHWQCSQYLNLAAWIVRIFRNYLKNELKRRQTRMRREKKQNQNQIHQLVAPDPQTEGSWIWDCLERLEEVERQILVSSFRDGLSRVEIAQLLNLTENQVDYSKKKAIANLRDSLGGAVPFEL